MQRSLGLELSCLKPLFDASAARGLTVTQSARLGDEVLLNANNTARHNAGLSVVHSALSQLTAATLPASHLALGDRGDGTPASKEEAKRRHADLNEGHVPDLYRRGVPTLRRPIKREGAQHLRACGRATFLRKRIPREALGPNPGPSGLSREGRR